MINGSNIRVRKSSQSEFADAEALNSLFKERTIEDIVEFFDLPSEYFSLRQQDYGTCELLSYSQDTHLNKGNRYIPIINYEDIANHVEKDA